MKHINMRGNRITTSVSMHSRTHDVLKAIKIQRDEKAILSILDALFSNNTAKRNEALKWLLNFCTNVMPNAFSFNETTKTWDFVLDECPDVNMPLVPDKHKKIYFFNDSGEIEFFPNYKNLED